MPIEGMGPGWVLEKVISGMQTGVDQVGLRVARELGYQTGGVAPRGFRTDGGPAPQIAALYGVTEHKVSDQYAPRTRENVRTSDGTVIFCSEETLSPGCVLTMRFCRELKKPYVLNPTAEELRQFILNNVVRTLNVAGNRHRTHPEVSERAAVVLRAGLLPF